MLSSLGLASQAMGQVTCPLYIIGDTVWLDTNGNGQQELAEPGVSGVLLELLDGSMQPVLDVNGNPVTTLTDANGHYQFQVHGKCEVVNPNYGLPGHESEPQTITYYDGVYASHVASSNFSPLGPLYRLVCSTGSVQIRKTVIDQNIYDLSSVSEYDFGFFARTLICPNPLLGDAGYCTVLQLNGGQVAMSSGSITGILGDLCIAGTGKLSMSGGQFISGQAYLAAGATTAGPAGTTRVLGGVVYPADLSAQRNSALALASSAAALPCDRTLASLSKISTINPVHNGGQNVICVSSFQVASNQTVKLTGSLGTSYIFNVTGTFKVNGSKNGGKVLVGDNVEQRDVLYNVIGAGTDVVLMGGGGGSIETINAVVDGTILAPYRKIALNPGLVNGQILSAKDISMAGGSFVQWLSCD